MGGGDHITPQKCRGLRRRGEAERAAERGAETGEHMKECITEGGGGDWLRGMDGERKKWEKGKEEGVTLSFFKTLLSVCAMNTHLIPTEERKENIYIFNLQQFIDSFNVQL